MRRTGALLAASVVLLGLGPLWAQETPKAPLKIKRNDAIARAFKKAEAQDGMRLSRVTMAPNDDGAVLAVCEYGSGEIGLFVGDSDAAGDMFAIVTGDNIKLLREAILRSPK